MAAFLAAMSFYNRYQEKKIQKRTLKRYQAEYNEISEKYFHQGELLKRGTHSTCKNGQEDHRNALVAYLLGIEQLESLVVRYSSNPHLEESALDQARQRISVEQKGLPECLNGAYLLCRTAEKEISKIIEDGQGQVRLAHIFTQLEIARTPYQGPSRSLRNHSANQGPIANADNVQYHRNMPMQQVHQFLESSEKYKNVRQFYVPNIPHVTYFDVLGADDVKKTMMSWSAEIKKMYDPSSPNFQKKR